ncbi:hypothetical protein ACVWW6_000387 [Bradyrhizobium sp. USDA 3311]
MLTARFLEGMNGVLFFLLLFGCFMFGLYIAREVIRSGFQRMPLQAAISIFVLIGGEAVARGWLWWWRHLVNRGLDAGWMIEDPVLLVGAFVEILGIICVIRVFAPDHWGRNVWIGSSLFATTLTVLFFYI